MTDRLRIGGVPVITEDDSTGNLTIEAQTITTDRLHSSEDGQLVAWVDEDRIKVAFSAFIDMNGRPLLNVQEVEYEPTDVRNLGSPLQGLTAYHDGSGTNTEGPAHYTSNDEWVSTVDGTTIS